MPSTRCSPRIATGDARKPDPPVTDAPEDDPARNHLALVGGDSLHAPPPVGLERVGRDLDGFHPLVTEDPDRGEAKPQAHDLRLAARLTRGELAEDLDVPLHEVRGVGELRLARGVELERRRVDDDVRAGELVDRTKSFGAPASLLAAR